MNINEAVKFFMLEQRTRGNSPKTLLYYSDKLGRMQRYFETEETKDTKQITIHLLRKYALTLHESTSLSSISVQSHIRAIRAFLTWCYDEEYMQTNLSLRFKLPRAQKPEIDVLTRDEIKRLMGAFNLTSSLQLRNYCICALMLDCGLRKTEVITLRLSFLYLQEGYIIVDGKGNKQRTVPIGNHTQNALMQYLKLRPEPSDTIYLFVTDVGERIQDTTIKQLFRKLKLQSGIQRLHAHLLRHTFATYYLENGGDIFSLQQILGHTSLEMVKRYVHLKNRRAVRTFPQYSPLDKLNESIS